MGWLYNVTNNSTAPTANNYNWFGLNALNQDASLLYIGGTYAVTKIRVLVNGHDGSCYARLCIWNGSNGYLVAQTDTFTMTSGYESVGGQAWQEITLPSPVLITQGNYYVGVYRNPSGGHISGTHTSITSIQKTNTNGFPYVVGMAGYQTDNDEGILVGLYLNTAPTAPNGAAVARNYDTSATVNWFNNSSADAPYDSIEIQRWDNVTNGYYKIATISGSSTSYTDTTIKANRMYKYAVCARNTVGNSSFNYTDYIKTTPSAPSGVGAYRSGSSAVVYWTDNSTCEDHFYIQSSTYSGGVWGSWVNESEVSANSTSWTDTTPPNVVKYRVKALTDTYNSLSSAYVVSNELAILQVPSAPTNLSPDNVYFDATESKVFTWTHNPLDGSNQTKYSIQYRTSTGSYPGTPQKNAVSSSTSSCTFPAGTFTNGTTYKYQVKTWGAYSTASAWSAEKTFYCYARPVGTITSPTVANDYALSTLALAWSFTGNTQTEFLAKLYDSNDVLLETQSVSGADVSVTFNTSLANITDYSVTLQVKDSTDLWSIETSVAFNTVFAVPATPTLVLANDIINGLVNIEITNPSPTGTEIEAVTNNVYRSIDGGVTYELIEENVPTNTTVVDYVPNIGGNTYYYVDAVSATPTIASSIASYVTINMTGYYIFNTGSNFGTYILMVGDISFSEKIFPDVALNKYEGRTYPVKYIGTSKNQGVNFSCDLPFDDYETMMSIIDSVDDIVFRDWKNRWFYCVISNISFNKKDHEAYQFSCEITRVEGGAN